MAWVSSGGGLDADGKATELLRVREHKPQILGLSALLTTTMPGMQTVIEALESAGVRDRVKVMVGGAPVTEEFATSIGADGYGRDAVVAADKANELVGVR